MIKKYREVTTCVIFFVSDNVAEDVMWMEDEEEVEDASGEERFHKKY